MEHSTTTSNVHTGEITIETLKMATDMILTREEKPLPRGLSWLARIMAKFGWHRKYEILIFDKAKFGNPLMSPFNFSSPKIENRTSPQKRL